SISSPALWEGATECSSMRASAAAERAIDAGESGLVDSHGYGRGSGAVRGEPRDVLEDEVVLEVVIAGNGRGRQRNVQAHRFSRSDRLLRNHAAGVPDGRQARISRIPPISEVYGVRPG